MNRDQALREHVLDLLSGGNAHLDLHSALANVPSQLRGARPAGFTHTPWRLLEHMRIAQWDIVEFCRNPHHVSPDFPDGYWPQDDAPPTPDSWDQSVSDLGRDLQAMHHLVADPGTDLFAAVPGGDGQTFLREALLVADHNAYHLGQLVEVLRALGAWPE